MSSRLDRLFVLLENGGSDATRQAAALQLGEIVKLHPHELSNLLSKLKLFLSSKSWETRIAAGQAVSAILSNVPPWDPQPQIDETKSEEELNLKNNGQLSLETFSIKRVLEKGSYLFAADEQDFDMENMEFAPNSKEGMAHQRNLINKKLGLDIVESLGINTQNIFSASDLKTEISQKENSKSTVGEVFQEELDSVGLQMSSRERNKAKRKAKHISQKKKSLSDSTDISCDEASDRKRLKISDGDKSDDGELFINEKLNSQEETWPLEQFAEHVSQDLFNCSWEVRHGAGTALRELIRLHGLGAGKRSCQTSEQMKSSHMTWLEDKALRIICVLALDRFGDFLADQVVAPVRETCAQVLGCIVKYLSERSIFAVWHQLQEMVTWSDWETRHGGFLGLKYLLAVREDLREKLIPNSYSYILKGLKDELDDVVAVAATCLVPVSDDLIHYVTLDVINELLHVLWKTLLDIDDLSASTNSILLLISKLLSYNKLLDRFDGNLSQLICRLWPFMYHSSSSVRSSTLKTIYILVEKFCASSYLTAKTSSVDSLVIKSKETLVESAKNLNISNLRLQTCSSNEVTESGLENVLDPLLNHTFQRGLLENVAENLNLIEKIWNLALKNTPLSNLLVITCGRLPSWLCLMMTNSKMALDASLMIFDFHSKSGSVGKSSSLREEERKDFSVDDKYFLGGSRDGEEDFQKIEENIIRARCCVAKLVGNLSNFVSQPMPCVEYHENETPILCYIRLLNTHLNSRSAAQRLGAGLVVREWAIQYPQTSCHQLLYSNILKCLQEQIYFDEMSWQISRLQQESKDFLNALREHGIGVDSSFIASPYLTFEQIENLCDSGNWIMKKGSNSVSEVLISQNKSLMKNLSLVVAEQNKLNVSVQSVIAGALVHFKCLPEKLNPLIKPLMESMKKETNEQLQMMASVDLTSLLELCLERQPSPNSKIVKNLASFLCSDEAFTPNILNNQQNESIRIYTLVNQIKSGNSYRTNSTTGRGPGRPPLRQVSSASSDSNDSMLDLPRETEVQNKNEKEVQRRGCTFALQEIAKHFGLELEVKLPYLVNMIFNSLENPPECGDNREDQQNIINWLQMIEVLIPVLNQNILNKFNSVLSSFDSWIYHPSFGIRHMGSRVFAVYASVSTRTSMNYMIENIVPNLHVMKSNYQRLGALEAVHLAIEKLGFSIVPYIVLLIVPLLGSMSDPLEEIRHLGAQCFATLIRLYPLDGGSSDATDISPGLCAKKKSEKMFLERLLDPTKIENYKLPVPINATLRSYQQKGINWLAFLRKFNLHGILCDDMGLGKTLQSICILAGDHYEKEKKLKENKKKGCGKASKLECQSLVVCPPTLTGHWYYEISKFISKDFLDPLHYTGPPFERKRLQNYFDNHNLIIASYKIVRNEISYFSKRKWNYIILDEGHTIKNAKTKSSKAIKELVCNHRLILTGTPIQNNVLELWSLFDFLMPGYLGTEKQFMSKYSKPIILSKEAKSSKEQKEGVLAMESLHRQVLPFIMRRVKEDVLKDLPPKIVQDYYCDLSPLQVRLYEDFAKARSTQINSPNNDEKKKPYAHIFQALQYLRRVCNHPKLALMPSHPQYEAVIKQIKDSKSSLSDISHSAKLPALKQLLLDCGIGVSKDDAGITTTSVISPHRALIFCQLKGMLDIIEQDLLKVHLPSVTYLRLDGSVPSNQRYDLIQSFNTDPSIDLLLLTTQVGGLGLNLTGADTVIFVEHDWNPMRDLQAMDRAHRIGQKRIVNVYRLVTKGTMEEKIMSLQKFKLLTANKVITQENSSLLSMGTDQLLELFTLDNKNQPSNNPSGSRDHQTLGLPIGGIKKAFESLPELWEQNLYEEEYNFDSYLQTLAQ